MKTTKQQGMQATWRSRKLLTDKCTAHSIHLRGILLGFGVAIPQAIGYCLRVGPLTADSVEKLCFRNRRFSICDLRRDSYRRYEEVVQFL